MHIQSILLPLLAVVPLGLDVVLHWSFTPPGAVDDNPFVAAGHQLCLGLPPRRQTSSFPLLVGLCLDIVVSTKLKCGTLGAKLATAGHMGIFGKSCSWRDF